MWQHARTKLFLLCLAFLFFLMSKRLWPVSFNSSGLKKRIKRATISCNWRNPASLFYICKFDGVCKTTHPHLNCFHIGVTSNTGGPQLLGFISSSPLCHWHRQLVRGVRSVSFFSIFHLVFVFDSASDVFKPDTQKWGVETRISVCLECIHADHW